MPKKSKLQCASVLFTCFSSSRKKKKNGGDVGDGGDGGDANNHDTNGDNGDNDIHSKPLARNAATNATNATNGTNGANGVNGANGAIHGSINGTNKTPKQTNRKSRDAHKTADRPQSRASDMISVGSHSVYFEANEGNDVDWHDADDGHDGHDGYNDHSMHSMHSTNSMNSTDGSNGWDFDFADLAELEHKIDGQFFFSALDDPTLSKEVFEGIHRYPPVPTTSPDPLPRSDISLSNMQTLLHTYQHEAVVEGEGEEKGEDEGRDEREEEEAEERVGRAMEQQAQRLLMSDKENRGWRESTKVLLEELKMPKVKVRERGFPGELTEEELEIVKQFQSELRKRDPVYYEIVRALSAVEKEAYALCRFLRARKFDVDRVFELLDSAVEGWKKAKEHDFYPDLEKAMGVSRSVFLSQYPAIISGNARNGCPVMYLQAGNIQPEGIKCVVSFDKVDRYFWNDIMYHLTERLKDGRRLNPQFIRTENMTIYDLKGVARSQISSDVFEMIKVGNSVMTSFPETLHCLLIINAPGWFGFVWSIIKKLIDPRTASKIEVFTNAQAGLNRINELIDKPQIPSDYGGTGPALSEAASGGLNVSTGSKPKIVSLSHLILLTKKASQKEHSFEVESGKQMSLVIYTRCKTGVNATLLRGSDSVLTEISVVGEKEDEPYQRTLGAVSGPGKFTVRIKSNSSPGNYLILGHSSA